VLYKIKKVHYSYFRSETDFPRENDLLPSSPGSARSFTILHEIRTGTGGTGGTGGGGSGGSDGVPGGLLSAGMKGPYE
jgi:hypothetical protein